MQTNIKNKANVMFSLLYLYEATTLSNMEVESIEVQGILADGWAGCDGGLIIIHKCQELV